ncbi:hypothetical protein SPD48_05065 [Pseudogracilibacillus sp. SE30717A]|uniref:hypothetical protein n=1 Tax=Pseudogracilibacillus sp. SE30717A TaxID=3098293 RepID=UPI00300DE6D8
MKKDVGSANGVTIYGEIKEISVLEERVLIFVKHWVNLPSVIKPVNYGIANYAMTTYELLIEAKELPELFMKSVDETVLWRMLRRISDKIKVNLNSENLDESSKINEYKIREITIRTDRDRNKLIISKGQYTKTLSMNILEKSPLAVFKALLEVINL